MIGYTYSAAWWRELEAMQAIQAKARASGDAIAQRAMAEALADSVMDDEADEGYFSQSEGPAK